MPLPDYQESSIVNLMSSLSGALGTSVNDYAELPSLGSDDLVGSRNIVLLVIDGLGYNYLRNFGQGSVMHKYLRAKLTSVFPSTTATAITTFMTGLAPQQHGLTGWFTYLKELGCITAVLPFRPRVGANRFDSNSIDIHRLYDHKPFFELIDCNAFVVAPEWIIHSEFNTVHSGSALLYGYNSLGECFDNIETIVKKSTDKKYIYAYWPDFDRLSHDMGCHSEKVNRHFAELDEAFEHLIHKLEGTDTTVIVTADHGFIDTEVSKIIHVHEHMPIQQALVMPLSGEPRASYCYVHPHQEQEFIDYITTELAYCMDIKASHVLVAEGYFGKGKVHPKLHERIGHYTLLMKDNYIIKDQLAGEKPFVHIGVHGGISPEEMFVPLVLARC